MIKTDSVTKGYLGKPAIEAVSIHVEKGSVYGLVGPNGAGKTTLIKMLTGIYRPDHGQVTISGEPVEDNPQVKSTIYYMPDEVYFERGSRIKNLKTFHKGLYKDFNEDRYYKLLDHFQLKEKQKINQLSKGMKKQVALLLGLSQMPEVMILDEPIDGLDPVIRHSIWSMIMQDVAERQMTVLISSHNLKELEGVCDTIGILHKGRLVTEKTMEDMKASLCKVQVACKEAMDLSGLQVLHRQSLGSLETLIIKAKEAEVRAVLSKYPVKLMDFLPLTFEEVFIYEVGGAGYDIQQIIL